MKGGTHASFHDAYIQILHEMECITPTICLAINALGPYPMQARAPP